MGLDRILILKVGCFLSLLFMVGLRVNIIYELFSLEYLSCPLQQTKKNVRCFDFLKDFTQSVHVHHPSAQR